MALSDFEKAEAFKDTLEVTFQENAEPYSDDKIEEVESLVNHYFDNFNTLTPPPHFALRKHHTISTCLFADDSAALTQGVNLKFTIKTMQHFLVKLEKWLTDWRIVINVEKTQAIVFRKWGVIDPKLNSLFSMTTFCGSRSFVTWAYISIVD
ncbi:hypothetical protein TNCV_4569141 [Trichonephila clavipes]|nr:hypothetical protein TNCV_4569141 [Trichonephila clavipes]